MNEIARRASAANCPICGKATTAVEPFCSKRSPISTSIAGFPAFMRSGEKEEDEDGERPADGDAGEKTRAPVRPTPCSTLQARRITRVGYVPDAGHSRLIDAAVPIRHSRHRAHHRGRGHGPCGRRLAWRRALGAADAIERASAIDQSALACELRFPLLMMMTMRGEWEEFNPWQVPMGSIVDPDC